MSDYGDGDELAIQGAPDTKSSLRVKQPGSSQTAKRNSRPVKSSKVKGVRNDAPIPITDESEVENADPFDFTGLDDDDDGREGRRNTKIKPPPGRVNGKQKAKGGAQASRTSHKQAPAQPIEVLDDVDDGQIAAANDLSAVKQLQHDDNVARISEQLRRAEAQIKTLSEQLEEVFDIRETEPEKLLKDLEIRHQAQLHAQEALIKELTSQISMKIPLMKTGEATVLNLLTREAADEEKRVLEQQVGRWRDSIDEHKRTIKERDDRILALEQKEKELTVQLNAEIERSASLAKAKHPPRGGRPGGVDDPRHAEVLRFYEDVTNLLVPNMKTQPGQYLGMEDWVLSCIYTFSDDKADDSETALQKSLSFTLRLCHEPPGAQGDEPITSKDQLIPTVHFTPLELDKEPQDFVQRLDFLQTPFSFARNQLPLFLRTMHKRMRGAALELDSDEDSDED